MKVKINLLLMILISCFGVAGAQVKTSQNPLKPKTEIRETNCEQNNSFLSNLDQYTEQNDLIIIVSHLGKNEKKEIGLRRLHNARIFLTKEFSRSKRSFEFILPTEGQTVEDKGHLDFFVRGELELRVYLGKNHDLHLPPCVLQPEEKPCSTKLEKMFYPCKLRKDS